MKIIKRSKLTFFTDVVLVAVFTAVFAVSFFPERIIPIYSGENFSAIYNGGRDERNVSLMFNVYENTPVVNGILDVLEEYGAKATFFVGGCWADDNAETLIRIAGSGHEIGNHGYFHKDHKLLSYDKNREEIYMTELITFALCGVKTGLFAPPSGSFSSETLSAAEDLGYKVIMWSKDTIDWRDKEVSVVFDRATVNLACGDLVLMHPKEHTLEALPKILRFYAENGFSAVTVGENIKDL